MKRLLSLDSILERGERVHDILAIISLSAGVNILTGISSEGKTVLCSIKFWLTSVSGILLILSGVSFSWLSYWIRKYVGFSLVGAAQEIIKEEKGKIFRKHSVKAWSFLIAGILLFLISKIYE